MEDVSDEARRGRSAALFNNSHVVDVVLHIAALTRSNPSEFVTTRKIAAATGIGDSLVRPVMLRLESARLLHRLPRMGGPRSEQFYTRATTPEWTALASLCRALGADVSRRRSSVEGAQRGSTVVPTTRTKRLPR